MSSRCVRVVWATGRCCDSNRRYIDQIKIITSARRKRGTEEGHFLTNFRIDVVIAE